MKATLEHTSTDGLQRFYRLSQPIRKGCKKQFNDGDIAANIATERFKPGYGVDVTNGLDLVCVSDAHTHIERLVFAAIQYDGDKYGRLQTQLDGAWTFKIHGGDPRAVKRDAVYLRRLASVNGYKFEGIDTEAKQ